MSAFMINANVMTKIVTAILLNLDTFDGENTCRDALLAKPTDAQKEAGTKIGRKLFLMNGKALRARYGDGNHLCVPDFVFGKWADAGPIEQFAASRVQDRLKFEPDTWRRHGGAGILRMAAPGGNRLGGERAALLRRR